MKGLDARNGRGEKVGLLEFVGGEEEEANASVPIGEDDIGRLDVAGALADIGVVAEALDEAVGFFVGMYEEDELGLVQSRGGGGGGRGSGSSGGGGCVVAVAVAVAGGVGGGGHG